jgi:hypothetical protein
MWVTVTHTCCSAYAVFLSFPRERGIFIPEVESNRALGKDRLHLKITAHCFDIASQGAQVDVGALLDLRDCALVDAQHMCQIGLCHMTRRAQLLERKVCQQLRAPGLYLSPILRTHLCQEFTELTSHDDSPLLLRLTALFEKGGEQFFRLRDIGVIPAIITRLLAAQQQNRMRFGSKA